MSYTADILQSPDVKKMGSDVTYARRIHHNLDEEESNMNHARQIGDRIADKSSQPDERIVSEWMGPEVFQHWVELRSWIEASYPGLFAPDWIYGGKKRGWSLRYKKTKAFCTLLPAYRLLSVLVVLGRAEREKFEARRYSWTPQLVKLYDETRAYPDGKWLTVPILSEDDMHEVTELMSMKRPTLARLNSAGDSATATHLGFD